jgi:hypothetical protein
MRLIAVMSACSFLTVPAMAHTCQYEDNYAIPVEVQGEAEILEMYNAFAATPEMVQCDFYVGDLAAAVAVINDWPGGVLTQNATLFYCGTDVDRCSVEDIDYGFLEPGDYMLVAVDTVPWYFEKPVCNLDWHTEIFVDGRSWDIGGLGELAPGPDEGPQPLCDCAHFRHATRPLAR